MLPGSASQKANKKNWTIVSKLEHKYRVNIMKTEPVYNGILP